MIGKESICFQCNHQYLDTNSLMSCDQRDPKLDVKNVNMFSPITNTTILKSETCNKFERKE